jgi:CheY-like chemotaxis protein
VQEHGGRIRLDSVPGIGASFYVELPVTGSSLPNPPANQAHQGSTEGVKGASILIVEDETALATAVSDALRDAGYLVQRASNGYEALEMIRKHQYELIVCDLKMPRLDGQAFYRIVAESSPALARRVVFVTGDVAGTDAEQFLEESGCRWLAKPFRLADLLRAVREELA